MKRLLVPAILALAVAAAPAADLKIGVVDMAKAFVEFYKTKEANAAIQDMANKVKEDLSDRAANYKKLVEQAEKLDKERRDPVLSMEMRQKKDQELQALGQEIKAMEREIQEFQQRKKAQLDQETMERRRGIYDEIHKAVEEKAKSSSLDLVLDKTNVSMSSVPLFLYLREGALPDITAEVIVDLNKNAPAGGPAATGSANLLTPTAGTPPTPPAPPADTPAPSSSNKSRRSKSNNN